MFDFGSYRCLCLRFTSSDEINPKNGLTSIKFDLNDLVRFILWKLEIHLMF